MASFTFSCDFLILQPGARKQRGELIPYGLDFPDEDAVTPV